MTTQLTAGLHRSAQQTPAKAATVFGDRVRTFAQQIDRVPRLAQGLNSLGIRDGDHVAILAHNSDRYAEYLLAVPWAGGILCPLPVSWSREAVTRALGETRARAVLVDEQHAALIARLGGECPELSAVVSCGEGPHPSGAVGYEDLVASSSPRKDAARGGADLAGTFYRDGVEAGPLALSHAELHALGHGVPTTPGTRSGAGIALHAAPMSDLAVLAVWVAQVLRGGTHVVTPFFDPQVVLDVIDAHHVSDVVLFPDMIEKLMDELTASTADAGLHRILCSEDSLPDGLVTRVSGTLRGLTLEKSPAIGPGSTPSTSTGVSTTSSRSRA